MMATTDTFNDIDDVSPSKAKLNGFPKIVLSTKIRKMDKTKKKKPKTKLICEKCDMHFPNWWEIVDHWRSTGHKAPEQCRWCNKKTFTLQTHLCKQHWNLATMCNYCGQLFMFQEDLGKHLLFHNKTKYRCYQCGRRKKTEDKLIEHMYNHFIYEKYGCNVCEKRFKKKKNIEKHLKTIHFICQYCGKQCDHKEEFKKHIETHNDLKCTFCKKVFSQKNRLKYHYQLRHGHQDFYKCTVCFQRFVIKTRLLDHMKLKHRGKVKYSCEICAAPFLYRQQYIVHFENMHAKPLNPGNFQCSFCDFSTDSKCKLQWHVEKVSGSGFFCKKCQVQMECKGIYDKHMKIHSGEKVWDCDYCSRSYSSDNTLRHHISLWHREQMIALNPKGFPCLVEGCDRYYTLKNSLTRHMRRSHAESFSHTCSETTVVCRTPLVRIRKRLRSSSPDHCEKRKSTEREIDSTVDLEVSSNGSSSKKDQESLTCDGEEKSSTTEVASSNKKDQDMITCDGVEGSNTTEVDVYNCNTCRKFWFDGESQFRRHMRTHAKQVWDGECSDCELCLESPEEAAKHFAEDHLKVEYVC